MHTNPLTLAHQRRNTAVRVLTDGIVVAHEDDWYAQTTLARLINELEAVSERCALG